MHRRILHLDLEALASSVEQRDRHELRGKPVAVTRPGAGPAGSAVLGQVSPEAFRAGVRPGMAVKDAQRACPALVVLPADPLRYRHASQQVHAILSDFTTRIEALSLEACLGDLTGNGPNGGSNTPGGSAVEAARRIRDRVSGEVGLRCTIGLAPSKLVAKLAAESRPPSGLAVVEPEQVCAFLHPLPVERLSGVGKATARRLGERGIHTVGDLAKLSEAGAIGLLGRSGSTLWRAARGEEPTRPVSPDRGRRTRGAERTFPVDVFDRVVLERAVERQVRELAGDLASAGERARSVTVKLRSPDFEVATRTRTLDAPTRDAAKLGAVARALLTERTDVGKRPIRVVGVSLAGLTGE